MKTQKGAFSALMKAALVDKIRIQLKNRLERLLRAVRESREAATDPDSKAESKYDTRNLEASYLAAGQARQVEDLSQAVQMFERVKLPEYGEMGMVGAVSLVELKELKANGESQWYLLVPAAGGLEVEDGDRMITLLSPDSPLYQQLLGSALGHVLEQPSAKVHSIL